MESKKYSMSRIKPVFSLLRFLIPLIAIFFGFFYWLEGFKYFIRDSEIRIYVTEFTFCSFFFLKLFLMNIYHISLGLNAFLFILGLIYYILRYQQNKENVQGTSEEYKSLRILILIILLICLIPEIFVIINMNLENTNIESITQQDSVNKFIPIIISHGFLVVF